jgi:hypothetical protein
MANFSIFLWQFRFTSFKIMHVVTGPRAPRDFIMRNSSPRVLAGVVMLALIASVGLLTARAFSVNSVAPSNEPTVAAEKANDSWNEVQRSKGPTTGKL